MVRDQVQRHIALRIEASLHPRLEEVEHRRGTDRLED
jgi:hypothetical protein